MQTNKGSPLFRLLQGLTKNEILGLIQLTCSHGHTPFGHPSCFSSYGTGEKIGILDIEASNLAASFGMVISYGLKVLGKDKVYGRALSPKEIQKHIFDHKLMEEFCENVKKFDRVVVHYGGDRRFDIPFLRTRCLKYDLDFPLYRTINVSDTWLMAKNKLKLHSNRLEAICDFFGVASKGHRLIPEIWMKALGGDQKSLDFIWMHNKEDLNSTEVIFEKLRDYYPNTKRSI